MEGHKRDTAAAQPPHPVSNRTPFTRPNVPLGSCTPAPHTTRFSHPTPPLLTQPLSPLPTDGGRFHPGFLLCDPYAARVVPVVLPEAAYTAAPKMLPAYNPKQPVMLGSLSAFTQVGGRVRSDGVCACMAALDACVCTCVTLNPNPVYMRVRFVRHIGVHRCSGV